MHTIYIYIYQSNEQQQRQLDDEYKKKTTLNSLIETTFNALGDDTLC
jgi:hypothetical protein